MALLGHYILVSTITKILQKRAGAKGYGTQGFAAGNCRSPLCGIQPTCQDLMTKRGCRHPNLSSHSMESCSMDVFRMAARAGWRQFAIGGSCVPESVPQGNLMGLVLIGDERIGNQAVLPVGTGQTAKRSKKARRGIRDLRKNMQALKQVNMTWRQLLHLRKEAGVMLQVSRNFRELEGSWRKAISLYGSIMSGVPQKNAGTSRMKTTP